MPCSSVAPDVTCSGVPLGNCWRQMWKPPPVLTERYIHLPSGDHAASVHCERLGPTGPPDDDPSNGTSRHGRQPAMSISTTSTERPSGDRRGAVGHAALVVGQVDRALVRSGLSSAVKTPMCRPSPVIDVKRTRGLPPSDALIQVSDAALLSTARRLAAEGRDAPGIQRVSDVKTTRELSAVNVIGPILRYGSCVSCAGSPLGSSFT